MTTPWLKERAKGLGGSDIAALFGASPWQSRLTLWAEKTGRSIPEDIEYKEFVEWGNRLEAPIMEAYWERTQRVPVSLVQAHDPNLCELIELEHYEEPKLMLRSKKYPWALATPDGAIAEYQPLPWESHADERFLGPGILEVKTTNAFKKGDWKDGPPPYYLLQAQHYMLVTGLRWASFAVLIGGQELRIFDVARDEETIAKIIEQAGYFWETNILQDVTPNAAGSKSEAALLDSLFPTEDPEKRIVLPEAARTMVEAMKAVEDAAKPLRAKLKELEERKTACKNNLKMMVGDASFGQTEDGMVSVTYKTSHRKGYTVKDKSYRTLRVKHG